MHGIATNRGPERALPVDKLLLVTTVALTLFGLVMIYSSSAFLADKRHGSQFYFLLRQSAWAALGLLAMAAIMRIDYRNYKRPIVAFGLLGISMALLGAALFMPPVNKAHRWIRYGPASLQPSELAKLALAVFLAFSLERNSDRLRNSIRAVLPAALAAGATILLVALEPDLGTALLIGLVSILVMFLAGARPLHMLCLAAIALPPLGYMLIFVPWRLERILALFDLDRDPAATSYQISQSIIAIGSGGLLGRGFAEGRQKLFYLPIPHSDFIFAVIGEELGLLGASLLVLAFLAVAWRGLRASRRAPDLFGQLLSAGLTATIVVQAFLNMSVAMALLPAKGITLPFVSYGGSSLAANLCAAAVLLNISKHASEDWH
jgi:cell division protein FtsW